MDDGDPLQVVGERVIIRILPFAEAAALVPKDMIYNLLLIIIFLKSKMITL